MNGRRILLWSVIPFLIVAGLLIGNDGQMPIQVLGILGPLATIVIIVLLIRHGVSSGIQRAKQQSSPANDDDPGNYKVVGVDRTTRMDTTWYVDAVSRENAKVKAELEGIIVTSITRV